MIKHNDISENAKNIPSMRPGTLSSTVAATIIADIKAGRFADGQRLPAEMKLQQMFQVSRHTIREALRELRNEGYVVTLHGIGTVVSNKEISFRFIHNAAKMDDVVQFSQATTMQVVAKRKIMANEELSILLGCAINQSWVELTILRYTTGTSVPLGLLRAYIRPEYEAVADHINSSKKPLFMQLEDMFGVRITEMEQEIASVSFDLDMTSQLQAPVGGHGLRITRRFRDNLRRLIEVSIGFYPSDRLVQTSTLQIKRQPESS